MVPGVDTEGCNPSRIESGYLIYIIWILNTCSSDSFTVCSDCSYNIATKVLYAALLVKIAFCIQPIVK